MHDECGDIPNAAARLKQQAHGFGYYSPTTLELCDGSVWDEADDLFYRETETLKW